MKIHVLPAGPIQTNAYLLTAAELGEAVLIDAPGDVWPAVAKILTAEKCRLTELWITHGHWDHTQGADEVIRASGARVRAHADDKVLLETPEIMEQRMGWELGLKPIRTDVWLIPGEKINVLGTVAEVRHVPGHCPGNVLFYFSKEGFAVVGDAIFQSSIGRTDLPGGDHAVLEKSIRTQIYTLPDATVLHPGHGPATTVGREKTGNPYVRP
jgi:hydroxyacylglutathione hydrolase